MGNYKIVVKVDIEECPELGGSELERMSDGKIEIKISEGDAISIDRCEKALLRVGSEAMRDAISKHLSEVSKKSLGARMWRRNNSQSTSLSGRWRGRTI